MRLIAFDQGLMQTDLGPVLYEVGLHQQKPKSAPPHAVDSFPTPHEVEGMLKHSVLCVVLVHHVLSGLSISAGQAMQNGQHLTFIHFEAANSVWFQCTVDFCVI